MKVIDLLNKIANGEKTPRKIKFRSSTFYYDKCLNWYYTSEKCEMFMDYTTLNDEVKLLEIIEDTPKEDKKIENNNRINRLHGFVPARLYLSKKPYDEDLRHVLENIGYKINEIIDRLNGEDNE